MDTPAEFGSETHHQPAWILHRQGLQKKGVDQAENGGIDADSERQREDGNGGETGVFPQRAARVAEILEQILVHGVPSGFDDHYMQRLVKPARLLARVHRVIL